MPSPNARTPNRSPTEGGLSSHFNQASGHSFLDKISTFFNDLKTEMPQGADMGQMIKAFMDNIGTLFNKEPEAANPNTPDVRTAPTPVAPAP